MRKRKAVCQLEDLDDPGSRGFSIQSGNETLEGFVVQRDAQVFAYRNRCPHTGSPLDWVEHQFLDLDKAFIQCAVHDALFEIDSGFCVAGPCPGESLQSLEVEVVEQTVYLVFGD